MQLFEKTRPRALGNETDKELQVLEVPQLLSQVVFEGRAGWILPDRMEGIVR